MLTLSLDEYGDFEGLKNTNEPIYIAGVIYEDKKKEPDTNIERKRIKEYYKQVIEDAKKDRSPSLYVYPDALHSNGDKSRDHNVVKPVKQQVNSTLKEFLLKGTYKGNELVYPSRKGRYHIFVILKSKKGMEDLLKNNASFFARDDYASNLYFHMANQLISKLVFHNPLIENIDDIWLDIATRTSANFDKNDPICEEYNKLKYQGTLSSDKKSIYYKLTNADIYRSVISKEMVDTGKTNLTISNFRVRSITYKSDTNNMEFLYLADTICSILGFNLKGDNEDAWLEEISKRTKSLTGRENNLIFGYDEVDLTFSEAYRKYEQGDYYEALSKLYDIQLQRGKFAEFYQRQWAAKLEEAITKNGSIALVNIAVMKLEDSIYKNGFNQDKSIYIYNIIEQLAKNVFDELEKKNHNTNHAESQRMLYTLYDVGVTCFCHIGDSMRARECFEKCKQYAGAVGLETYLYTRNKVVVYNTDCYEFDNALELAREDLTYHELLSDLKKEINLPGSSNLSYGQAYSQLGQTHAFVRSQEAEDLFIKALECFPEDSDNYKKTESYLLHYYLDNKNEKYLEASKHYFGQNESIQDQLKYISEEGQKENAIIDVRFAMYVFIRGVYTFRMNEVTGKTWKYIKSFMTQNNSKFTGHPCEIIYKYMSFIALMKNDPNTEDYLAKVKTCLANIGKSIEALIQYGEIEYAKLKEDDQKVNYLSDQLYTKMLANFPVLKEKEDSEDSYHWLSGIFTFMYH